MIRRMDQNNNGLIEPGEAEGPARFMLQRMAGNVPGIDLSRPVSVQSRGDRSGSEGRSRDSDARSRDSDNRSSRGVPPPEPLVPGFGVTDDLPLPLPFGVKAPDVITVTVNEGGKLSGLVEGRFGSKCNGLDARRVVRIGRTVGQR
jgi:hypothetical protein